MQDLKNSKLLEGKLRLLYELRKSGKTGWHVIKMKLKAIDV